MLRLSVLGLVVFAAAVATGARTQIPSPWRSAKYQELKCDDYSELYSQIDRDLEIHRLHPVTQERMDYTTTTYGTVEQRALVLGVFNGTPYLLKPSDWKGLSHHASLLITMVRMLQHLADLFGKDMPDVAYTVTSSDVPRHTPAPLWMNPVANRTLPPERIPKPDASRMAQYRGPFPVFAFCKSDYHADTILIPAMHFHMRDYDKNMISKIPEFKQQRAWAEKEPKLFGRFSRYKLIAGGVHNPFISKVGVNGSDICDSMRKTCPTRHVFMDFAAQHRDQLDVQFSGMRPILAHTAYKYLINLEGQALSTRMEVLLPLGSLVFKEHSGYYTYYYHLLKHRHNMIEFWRPGHGPEDVLEELAWARDNDEEAQRIAVRGQELAAKYLTGKARTCYWYRLLHEYSKVFDYKVQLSQWPEARPLSKVLGKDVVKELLPLLGRKDVWGP